MTITVSGFDVTATGDALLFDGVIAELLAAARLGARAAQALDTAGVRRSMRPILHADDQGLG